MILHAPQKTGFRPKFDGESEFEAHFAPTIFPNPLPTDLSISEENKEKKTSSIEILDQVSFFNFFFFNFSFFVICSRFAKKQNIVKKTVTLMRLLMLLLLLCVSLWLCFCLLCVAKKP